MTRQTITVAHLITLSSGSIDLNMTRQTIAVAHTQVEITATLNMARMADKINDKHAHKHA